jgi:hypothetical protein
MLLASSGYNPRPPLKLLSLSVEICVEELVRVALNDHVLPYTIFLGLFFPAVEFVWFRFNVRLDLLGLYKRHMLVLEIAWVADWGCFHCGV